MFVSTYFVDHSPSSLFISIISNYRNSKSTSHSVKYYVRVPVHQILQHQLMCVQGSLRCHMTISKDVHQHLLVLLELLLLFLLLPLLYKTILITETFIVKIETKRLFSGDAYPKTFDVGQKNQAQGICS